MEAIATLNSEILATSVALECSKQLSKQASSEEAIRRSQLEKELSELKEKHGEEKLRQKTVQAEIDTLLQGSTPSNSTFPASPTAADTESVKKEAADARVALQSIIATTEETRRSCHSLTLENETLANAIRDISNKLPQTQQQLSVITTKTTRQDGPLSPHRAVREIQMEANEMLSKKASLEQRLADAEKSTVVATDAKPIDLKGLAKELKGSLEHQLASLQQENLDIGLQKRLSGAEEEMRQSRVNEAVLMEDVVQTRQQLRFAQLEAASFESEAELAGKEAARSRMERKDLEYKLGVLRDRLWVIKRTEYKTEPDLDMRQYGTMGHRVAERLIAEVQQQGSYRSENPRGDSSPSPNKFSTSFDCSSARNRGDGAAGHTRDMVRSDAWARDVMASMLDAL